MTRNDIVPTRGTVPRLPANAVFRNALFQIYGVNPALYTRLIAGVMKGQVGVREGAQENKNCFSEASLRPWPTVDSETCSVDTLMRLESGKCKITEVAADRKMLLAFQSNFNFDFNLTSQNEKAHLYPRALFLLPVEARPRLIALSAKV